MPDLLVPDAAPLLDEIDALVTDAGQRPPAVIVQTRAALQDAAALLDDLPALAAVLAALPDDSEDTPESDAIARHVGRLIDHASRRRALADQLRRRADKIAAIQVPAILAHGRQLTAVAAAADKLAALAEHGAIELARRASAAIRAARLRPA